MLNSANTKIDKMEYLVNLECKEKSINMKMPEIPSNIIIIDNLNNL